MARIKDREKALKLRKKGFSYSMIKDKLGVSKSTLSSWLSDFPLSENRIQQLQARNPKRIERFRNTMKKKRDERRKSVLEKARKDLGKLSKRDLFLAGLFLYWGEGTKTAYCKVSLSNTKPAVIRFFIKWLTLFDVSSSDIFIRLHLYDDMDIDKEIAWWCKELKISKKNFKKPYIKESNRKNMKYSNISRHGTCNADYYSRDVYEYIMACLECF